MGVNIYYDRLKAFWESEGYKNANQFANALGYARSQNIKRLDREENGKPGIDLLEAVVKKFPHFNTNYYLTGDERFLKEKYPGIQKIKDTANEPNRDYTETMSPVEHCDNPSCLKRISELEQDKQLLIDYNNLLRAQLARGGLDNGKSSEGGVEKSATGS